MSQTIDEAQWRRHALQNRLHTAVLLAVMAAFLGLLGWLIAGDTGLVLLLLGGALLVLFSPALSPRLVMRLYRAQPLPQAQFPELHQALSLLSERAGLPARPVLFYVPSTMVNAFAVGRPQEAAIGVTDGLLRNLNLREAIGVLAHEVSHIRSNDMWVMGLADLFSRLTSALSLFGQLLLLINLPLLLWAPVSINWFAIGLLVFAPTLSALAQLGLSRTREYDADLNAARLTGDPDALASALRKIEQIQGAWLERVFLPGRRVPEPSLLRTHPPTEERVRRLMELKKRETPPWQRLPFDAERVSNHLGTLPARRHAPRWKWTGLWY